MRFRLTGILHCTNTDATEPPFDLIEINEQLEAGSYKEAKKEASEIVRYLHQKYSQKPNYNLSVELVPQSPIWQAFSDSQSPTKLIEKEITK
ncbi:MAG: hypothetical protein A2750_01430 [Candidatus Yanofskybacteria bacterium RIFCSPHIGHO2_01_FULL_45_42]|uniref:Uncharacterized protein n=2 Tax=Parcubacteria group TaxID=1794811 RepID=A0A1G1ZR04_9BACT|nr:MAG: hypothetical protein A2750_01430 [Candidatus Yanofskybacteria bacterium RIFCSPHIGHO2_01_FULL_45_42]OGY63881.1 MAG: hypothetical protein A3J53_03600 [Candidatus Harrisonbacteria bacterium RIFCSPHIGHO2_02_FULL_40_20]OGY66972.1 MAG: hypothetical protein A3I24_00660 [Candidatus Harrisonbacteria bacterium RIFCSPLOWO2_02_FULL_41_13b]